jgi:hypothetical protein
MDVAEQSRKIPATTCHSATGTSFQPKRVRDFAISSGFHLKPCSHPAVAAVAGYWVAVTTKCPYEVMSTPPVSLNLCHWLLQPARKRSYREKSVRHGTFALLADPLLQGGEGGGGVTAHARREQP